MYLNCHSYYSLRYGTFSEIELLQLAKENNIASIALTDINNTSACLNFVQQAKKQGIKPIVGVDFRNGNTQQQSPRQSATRQTASAASPQVPHRSRRS